MCSRTQLLILTLTHGRNFPLIVYPSKLSPHRDPLVTCNANERSHRPCGVFSCLFYRIVKSQWENREIHKCSIIFTANGAAEKNLVEIIIKEKGVCCHQALSPLPSWWWCHLPLQNPRGKPDTPLNIHLFIHHDNQLSRLQSVLRPG